MGSGFALRAPLTQTEHLDLSRGTGEALASKVSAEAAPRSAGVSTSKLAYRSALDDAFLLWLHRETSQGSVAPTSDVREDGPRLGRGSVSDSSRFLSRIKTTSGLLDQLFAQTRLAMVLTDPNAEDNPIVACNEAFCTLTGYERDEVVGRNCRFLQGEDTDQEEVARLRSCLATEGTCQFELLNHRKDGTPFWNGLHVSPIYGDDGKLAFYFGSQWNVTDRVEERHRADRAAERLADTLAAARWPWERPW